MIGNLLKYMSAKNCRKRLSFDFYGHEEAEAATLAFLEHCAEVYSQKYIRKYMDRDAT